MLTRPRRTPDGAGAGGPVAVDVFTTKSGTVRGRRAERDRGIVVVRGLPYAAPPFGALRFREPQPPDPWDGVRDCTAFGPVAPQSAELPGAPVWSPGDEDVLTLNIWTPADGPGDLPVLVWIHGGAYAFGSSAQPDFDGTALAGEGLVVVTLNSRLGFEGFGHVPCAGRRAALPDNRGLLDQIAALEWVRDNIAAFGGSPARVTLAGQSSGATSVACLTVADRARGLFRRAVLHSAVNAFASVEQAARTTAEVAAEAGVPATRAGLVAAPPEALVAATDRVCARYAQDPASGQRHYDPAIYGPVADGVLLTADPLEALAAGAGGAAELLVCHTTEEYWLLDAVGSSAKITTEEQLAFFAADFGLPASLVEGHRERLPDAPGARRPPVPPLRPPLRRVQLPPRRGPRPGRRPGLPRPLRPPPGPGGAAGPRLALRGHPVRLRQPPRGERPLPRRRPARRGRRRALPADDRCLGRVRRPGRPWLGAPRRIGRERGGGTGLAYGGGGERGRGSGRGRGSARCGRTGRERVARSAGRLP